MALTNEQYDRLQREYSRKLAWDREQQQLRIREAFSRIPPLKEMEETMADISFQRAKAMLAGNTAEAEKLSKQSKSLREEKEVLLAGGGFPPDYLELQYQCPLCKDTGYIQGKKCSCMKKAIIDMLYDQSAIRENLERENFDTFSYEFYDKTVKDAGTGLSSYGTMKKNVEISWDFIHNFGNPPQNLLLMGQAGTGKTFLSNCIAKELLERYHSVIYLSSSQFFDILAQQAFDREEQEDTGRYILTCDLLIIDDLGTELNNSFVGSRLFYCINERILRKKSTLISTNLGMNDMLRLYTERVTSRLVGNYRILQFPDQDIRIMKKYDKRFL